MTCAQKAKQYSKPMALWLVIASQVIGMFLSFYHSKICASQIREQMSGPEISQYEKSILGSGLDCEIKGSGPIMSNFWRPFFHFFGVKKIFFFENILASALKSCITPFL